MLPIVKKEFQDVLNTPKFWVAFLIFALIMLLSAYVGVQSYNQDMVRYQEALKKQEGHATREKQAIFPWL